MGFFTSRESTELGRPTETANFAPSRRSRDHDLRNVSVTQRVAAIPLQQIDDLIEMLQTRREALLSETVRVQDEIVGYAKLSQSTMQSTKAISDCLEQWRKTPESPDRSGLPQDDEGRAQEDAALQNPDEHICDGPPIAEA
jgi:hypothetical protein